MPHKEPTTMPISSIRHQGRSPVVLSGPHNGWHVPGALIAANGKPLGLEPFWFDPLDPRRRHEACDWGMHPLFERLEEKRSDICLIEAHYSRLVVDLNRVRKLVITETSSETDSPIPGNTGLSAAATEARINEYYTPYHKALDQVLQSTIAQFGSALWLDLHSFTPIWNGTPRAVKIGSLKATRSPHTDRIEAALESFFGSDFVPDQPYNMMIPPYHDIGSGREVAARNGLEYFGIEIRNDLLQTPAQIETMADQLLKVIEVLQ
ncbi:MAG: N-formylglutamate amidohydrolase [Alphaproteobacteria bacterium]